MQQEKHRRVFLAGLSVKDGEPVDLGRAEQKTGCSMLPVASLSLGQQFKMKPASVKPLTPRRGLASIGANKTRQKVASFASAFPGELPGNLENDFKLDRGAERKACDAIYQAARALVLSEDVLQQLRSAIGHFRRSWTFP